MPQFDTYSPWMIPTQEDVLDVNFWSIVSDCRAIKAGTLVPRSWFDISRTWYGDEPDILRRRATDDKRAKCSVGAKAAWAKKTHSRKVYVKKPKHLHRTKNPVGFRKMVNLLTANGCNVWDARMKARELLGLDGPIEIHR